MTLEEHRRALHEDGKRRYQEWHTAFLNSQRAWQQDFDRYHHAFTEDGKRRYQEWHTAFLAYQKRFQQEMSQI